MYISHRATSRDNVKILRFAPDFARCRSAIMHDIQDRYEGGTGDHYENLAASAFMKSGCTTILLPDGTRYQISISE